jgi:outer membrane protein assembly factor BamB
MYRSVVGATDAVVVVMEADQGAGEVFALDPDDGTELWRWEAPSVRRPPGSLTGSGVVVLLTGDREHAELVGVDALTGAERWRVAEPLEVLGSSEQVVAVERMSDVMGSEPIRGLDRATGIELWVSDVRQLDTSGVYGALESTAVWQDTLVVQTDRTATAVGLGTGTVRWSSTDVGTPIGADVAVIGAGPIDGPDATITATDPTTGEGIWTAPGRLAYGGYAAIGDGVVVVTDRDTGAGLVAYEQESGVERWRSDGHLQAHTVVGGTVVSLWEAGLDARATGDGTLLWQVSEPFGSPFMNNLAANTSTVFVAINSLPWND